MFDQTNAGTSPPPSALHHPFIATTFPDISATSMQQATFTLATLAALIADTRATEKRHLPWIKLASFGSKRSAKGCLRTNANVLEIFGLEGDCDLGTVSVDQAERLLKRARLNGLVYTSASHTKEKPRFRVLVLTSRPLPPTERPKLMARVNGVLKGCLSRESDTLSQSYYMGQVDGVEFDLRLIDGDFVDQRPDLDAQAVSPRPKRADPPPSNTPPPPSEAFSQAQRDKLVDRILGPVRRAREGSRHKERYDAGRHLAGVADELGLSDDDIVELVIEANPPDSDPEKEERAVRDGIDNGRAAPLSLGEQMSRYGLRPDKDFERVIVVPPVGTQDGEEPAPPPPPQPPRPPKPPGGGGGGGNGSAAPDDAEDGDAQSDDPSYEPTAINDGDGDEDIELPPHMRRTVAQWVNYLNRRYMVVCEAGRAMVYEQRHDPVRRRHYYVRITFDDLCRLYLNQSVQVGANKDGTPIWENVAKLWLRHRDRRQYLGGLVFDPSRKNVPDDAYNLWRGFAVKPVHGSWDKIRSHIFHIVCAGQQHLYDYVLRWLARMVQFPSEQGHVVLVLQGEEGSGKGAFAQMISNMLGQHALAISNTKHLTGNFNAHLADCLFLFADEALAPDEKTSIGIIKALVTEPFIFIERKRSDGSAQPNYLHLVMASNNKHVVPAALRSRRYVILQQPDTRIGDRVYFKALHAEINGDGIAAMLHDLLHMDISNFTVQDYPQTEGLDEQRKLSLPIELKWWHDCLEREFVYESKYGLDTLNVWESWKSTDILFASYETFAKGNRAPAMSREAFGKLMVKLSEGPLRASGREVIGEGRGEHTGAPTLTTKWRPTGYQLGTLAEARVRFANHTGLKLDWPDE